MKYTFEQINDISKDHNKIESILSQRDIFRKELIEMATEIPEPLFLKFWNFLMSNNLLEENQSGRYWINAFIKHQKSNS